jgi:hypothetical protein
LEPQPRLKGPYQTWFASIRFPAGYKITNEHAQVDRPPLDTPPNSDPPVALLAVILFAVKEPLAKILPATSNASVAVEFSPILNPLAVMLLLDVSFILKSSLVFAL